MHHDVQLHEAIARPPFTRRIGALVRRHRWFALFVVAPSVMAIAYFGLIASDIYVSEARFVIKSPSQKQMQSSTLASLIQTTGLSGGQEQTNEVIDYLRSRDALSNLSRRMNVKGSFTLPETDRFSRFPPVLGRDSFENLYKYYGKMVDARLDHDTNNAVLTVKAFTARDAYLLNRNLLELSEGLVNRLNNRANEKAIAEAESRVLIAQDRVRKARVELGRYRNDTELLDPQQQGLGVLEVSNGLVAQRATLQAQLATIERGAPANPSIPALRQQIAAITAQINAQNSRAVGSSSGIASKLSGYESLAVEQEFATQMLTAASASLEQARTEAMKQKFYLERVVEPNQPDQALLPARIKEILTVIGAALCLYLVGWMLIIGILEHSPED